MSLVKFFSKWSWRVQLSDYYAFYEHDVVVFVLSDMINVTNIYKSYVILHAIFLNSLPQSWPRLLPYLVYVQLLSILIHDWVIHKPSFLKRRFAITLALMVVYSPPGAYKSFCSCQCVQFHGIYEKLSYRRGMSEKYCLIKLWIVYGTSVVFLTLAFDI